MRKGLTMLILAGMFSMTAIAGVPNRIIYQGRLFKSGVGISGNKTILLTLVSPDGKTPYASKSFSVALPVTGEFTIIWDLESDIDWRGTTPELKVQVDADELTPRQSFSASPYSLVAKRVEIGGVDTLALADGAVTTAKIANEGLDPNKINLANGKKLGSWVTPEGKISAEGIEGVLSTTAKHAESHKTGGSDALTLDVSQVEGAVMTRSTFTQVMQATTESVPVLAVKGMPGSSSKVMQIYNSGIVGDTKSVP